MEHMNIRIILCAIYVFQLSEIAIIRKLCISKFFHVLSEWNVLHVYRNFLSIAFAKKGYQVEKKERRWWRWKFFMIASLNLKARYQVPSTYWSVFILIFFFNRTCVCCCCWFRHDSYSFYTRILIFKSSFSCLTWIFFACVSKKGNASRQFFNF